MLFRSSLHDALPISSRRRHTDSEVTGVQTCALPIRSEEHTSELQSPQNLLCRLLLEMGLALPPRGPHPPRANSPSPRRPPSPSLHTTSRPATNHRSSRAAAHFHPPTPT